MILWLFLGAWLSGRAPRSHRGGPWFKSTCAHHCGKNRVVTRDRKHPLPSRETIWRATVAKTELSSYTQTAPSSRRRQTPKCRQAPVRRAPDSVSVADLETFVDQWLFDGEGRHLSPRTLDFRRDLTQKLLWWLKREGHSVFGPDQVRGFLAYINTGHKEDGGRWGNPRMTRPACPGTTHTYYVSLTTFAASWFRKRCEASPSGDPAPAPPRPDPALHSRSVDALLKAARRSPNPKRDKPLCSSCWTRAPVPRKYVN